MGDLKKGKTWPGKKVCLRRRQGGAEGDEVRAILGSEAVLGIEAGRAWCTRGMETCVTRTLWGEEKILEAEAALQGFGLFSESNKTPGDNFKLRSHRISRRFTIVATLFWPDSSYLPFCFRHTWCTALTAHSTWGLVSSEWTEPPASFVLDTGLMHPDSAFVCMVTVSWCCIT